MAISCVTTVTATFHIEHKLFTSFCNNNDGTLREKEETLNSAELVHYDVHSDSTRLAIKPTRLLLLRTPLSVSRTTPETLTIAWTSPKLIFLNKPSFQQWENSLHEMLARKSNLTFVESDFTAPETAELEILYTINDALQSIPIYRDAEVASSKVGGGITLDVRPLVKESMGSVATRWKYESACHLQKLTDLPDK